MTIASAKKFLGELAKNMPDEEIQSLINTFNGIIEVGLRHFERKYKVKKYKQL
ncbi:MAG TPA: hypothetical protein VG895_02270 [Patescibacteria group bacterium]|nr:hypothetical protein [Patescibacteria group bacterium]